VKTCLPRERLESAVMGEAPEGLLSDIEQHAEGCARCRHELSWLRTEVVLFSQRAAREEVSRLWEGVAKEPDVRRPRRISRALLAIAASVFVAITVGGKLLVHQHSRGGDESLPMSLETMSVDLPQYASADVASMPCYTLGSGFACE
jgi:hypothetical protein